MTDKTRENEDAGHLHELINSFSTAMLVTIDPNGRLRSRPMNVAGIDEDESLWFATRFDSAKTDDLLNDGRVAVVMQGKVSFASITGNAEIYVDRTDKVEALWRETWRPWFPRGPQDPEIALLRVTMEDAAFWDYRGMAGLRYVVDAVKHAVKGDRMVDSTGGDPHQRVSS